MADERPRRVDRRRWRDSVVRHLEELAVAGSRLADLSRLADAGSPAQRAFEEFREAGVIDARLCRRLTRAQRGRSAIEPYLV